MIRFRWRGIKMATRFLIASLLLLQACVEGSSDRGRKQFAAALARRDSRGTRLPQLVDRPGRARSRLRWILVRPCGRRPGGKCRFASDVGRHRQELGAVWGGPLCVSRAQFTIRELSSIRDEIHDLEVELGLDILYSDINLAQNYAEVGVVLLPPVAHEEFRERYGDAVRMLPELRPVRA